MAQIIQLTYQNKSSKISRLKIFKQSNQIGRGLSAGSRIRLPKGAPIKQIKARLKKI